MLYVVDMTIFVQSDHLHWTFMSVHAYCCFSDVCYSGYRGTSVIHTLQLLCAILVEVTAFGTMEGSGFVSSLSVVYTA